MFSVIMVVIVMMMVKEKMVVFVSMVGKELIVERVNHCIHSIYMKYAV